VTVSMSIDADLPAQGAAAEPASGGSQRPRYTWRTPSDQWHRAQGRIHWGP